ncbi:MAG TPA: hypothetical protein VHH90_04570 [Polyangia bacterium]|nr:hypothetical protein [Polyangia bacterium]
MPTSSIVPFLLPWLLPWPMLLTLSAAWAGTTSPSGGEPENGKRLDSVEITLIADTPCAPRLREVLAEQVAGLAAEVVWSCRPRIEEGEPFRSAPGGRTAVRIWIDVATEEEARITLEDERSERFVVRRIPLPNGMDEVGREEIGQVVRSATSAILRGPGETVTRAEAQATLSSWATHAPVKVPSRNAPAQPAPVRVATAAKTPPAAGLETAGRQQPEGRTTRPLFEIGPAWSLESFSHEIHVVQEIALAASVVASTRPVSAWAEAGYRLPASYHTDPVGVSLGATSLRLGVTFERRGSRRSSFGVGLGGGLNRITFAPSEAAASVDAAPEGRFFTATVRLLLAADLRLRPHLALGIRLFCDVSTANVHYDVRNVGGGDRRVLTAFGVTPGLTLAFAWRP